MSFEINLGSWGSVFAVPTALVDKHIKLANSTQIKTLLWILRNSDKSFTVEDIAKALSKQVEDINDSLQYWVETKILTKSDNIYTPAQSEKNLEHEPEKQQEDTPSKEKSKAEKKKTVSVQNRTTSRRQCPNAVYLSERMKGSEEIMALMQESEMILGRPLSTPDCSIILMLVETDGLPPDVVLMLIQYAVSIGKGNMKYIEKLGIKWAEEEINSVHKAEKKILSMAKDEKNWKRILKVTGIEYHSETEREKAFVSRWINEWNFNDDMLREAYERCVDSTGKFTFSYANKILERWYKNSIFTKEQAKEDHLMSKTEKSKKKSESIEASYDIEEYENQGAFDD